MKAKPFKYTRLRKIAATNVFEFTAMEDLCRFAEANHLKDVFVMLNGSDTPSHFAVLLHNNLMQHATLGFETIDDYYAAKEKKFPDSQSYYDALREGYATWEDYTMVKEAGINDKDEFDKVKKGGYAEGFKRMKEANELAEGIGNPYQLYQKAEQAGFDNFVTYHDALKKGFADRDTYDIAKEYGFSSNADYADAKKRGFKTYEELKFANEKKVRDEEDMRRFTDLSFVDCTDCGQDERVLLTLVSKLEQGKRISINKLADLFQKMLDEYRYADTKQMPEWFTSKLNDRQAVINFLMKSEEARKFGTYDNDGEFFEINHMKDRQVVLDGSNVAHNSQGKSNTKAYVSNIIKLVSFLKKKEFSDITVMVDASLRHKLEDIDKLDTLKGMAKYLEAPKETSADSFMIKHVKHTHCLLVSNDTFREWKMSDPWIAENIDFYRLSFMINGDDVLMPDLK